MADEHLMDWVAQAKMYRARGDDLEVELASKKEQLKALRERLAEKDTLSLALDDLKKWFDEEGMPMSAKEKDDAQTGMFNREYCEEVYKNKSGYLAFHEGQASIIGHLEFWLKERNKR